MSSTLFFEAPLCAEVGGDLFFADTAPGKGGVRVAQNRVAIGICGACPHQAECLGYALRNDVSGVWGGTTYPDRVRLRKSLGVVAEPLSPSDYVGFVPVRDDAYDTASSNVNS